MNTAPQASDLTAKPGGWTELALTLPVFLVYQLGVVFLNVRNATDLVTVRMLALANGDRMTYLELTSGVGLALMFVFGFLGRGQAFRPSKILQIALEGAAYAIAMGTATSWVVGKMFAGPARDPGRRPVHRDRHGPRGGLLRGARVPRRALRPRGQAPRLALRAAAGRPRRAAARGSASERSSS